MIPKSLSATSLHVAALCMLRWKAEYIDRTPSMGSTAGDIGTAVHGGLEKYVTEVYINKTREPDLKLLIAFYDLSYMETFGHADKDTEEYRDGLAMTKRWFQRTEFNGVEVLTVELKEPMEIPVTDPATGEKFTVTFNYVMDRVDKLGPGEYRVVDYKTIRVPIQPDELMNKIQARAYALAIQRKYPDATKIRVQFDQLRHDPVGVIFTRDQNIETAHYIMGEAQRIIDTDESTIEPTLNMECGYCAIKATCPLLQRNITMGGLHSLTHAELAERKLQIESQTKANGYLLEEIDNLLLKESAHRDSLSWATEDGSFEVEVSASRRRQVDASAVARIIGPELFGSLGTITLGVLDGLIKDPNMPEEMVEELKKLIYYKTGDPKAKVKRKTKLL